MENTGDTREIAKIKAFKTGKMSGEKMVIISIHDRYSAEVKVMAAVGRATGCKKLPLGFPQSSGGKESARKAGDSGSIPGLGFLLEREYATDSSILGLPGGSAGKESACNTGDLGLIPGLGRSPGEGKGFPLQCSGLENSMRVGRDFHFLSLSKE